MRLFAQEKFSGTFETLMTTPVSDFQVVAAKFTAALCFMRDVAAAAGLPPGGAALHQQTRRAGRGDVGSTFLGILLLGGLFLSLGCCASALTRSQVIAAMISLVFGASVFLLGFLAEAIPGADAMADRRCCRVSPCSSRCTISPAAWWTPAR